MATPEGVKRTVRNLTDIAPTLYFNVPKGYELLIPHLVEDSALRENFFSRVKLMQYAGASLSQYVWDGLDSAARAAISSVVSSFTGYAPGCLPRRPQ